MPRILKLKEDMVDDSTPPPDNLKKFKVFFCFKIEVKRSSDPWDQATILYFDTGCIFLIYFILVI